MGNTKTKNNVAATIQLMIDGLKTHLAKKSLVLNGSSWKADELGKLLEAQISALKESDAARTRWLQTVAAQRKASDELAPMIEALRNYIGATYGTSSQTYTDFGFEARRKAKRTAASRAQAAEKLRATRAARHTMGRKQRQGIHGSISVETVSPVSSPPTNGAAVTAPTNGTSTNGTPANGVPSAAAA